MSLVSSTTYLLRLSKEDFLQRLSDTDIWKLGEDLISQRTHERRE